MKKFVVLLAALGIIGAGFSCSEKKTASDKDLLALKAVLSPGPADQNLIENKAKVGEAKKEPEPALVDLGSQPSIPEELEPLPEPQPGPEPDEAFIPVSPVGKHDSRALDEQVLARAKALKQDPKTLRIFVQSDARGAKVYRTLGMFIIVGPMKDEVFLPDNL